MTSGNSDRLARVADAVTCVKCNVNPRFGSLQRCKACLRADAELERLARERLLPAHAGPAARLSTRQQAAVSSSETRRKVGDAKPASPTAALTGRNFAPSGSASKSPSPAAPSRARPQSVRQPPVPLTPKGWKAKLAGWVLRCWGANDPDVQERIGTRDLGADIIEEHMGHFDVVYGGPHGAPHLRVFARSDPSLDVATAAFKRMHPALRHRSDVTTNGVRERRRLCPHCEARVLEPCNESRSRNCANRARGRR
jgi:hypothetical protein